MSKIFKWFWITMACSNIALAAILLVGTMMSEGFICRYSPVIIMWLATWMLLGGLMAYLENQLGAK
jgi:hypothetical protein